MALVKLLRELRNLVNHLTWRLQHRRLVPCVGMLCQLLKHIVCTEFSDFEFTTDIAKITVLLENMSKLVGNHQSILVGVSKRGALLVWSLMDVTGERC